MNEPWYSARCLFVHEHPDSEVVPKRAYEERIVLIRATGFDEAIRQAQNEAREYAAGIDGCRYLDHVDVFHLFDDDLASGTELYSIFRDGGSEPDAFVAQFTGDLWDFADALDAESSNRGPQP